MKKEDIVLDISVDPKMYHLLELHVSFNLQYAAFPQTFATITLSFSILFVLIMKLKHPV